MWEGEEGVDKVSCLALLKFQARHTLLPRQHITVTYMCCLGDVYMML